MKNTMERIAGMTYGVEVEYTGASRENVAKAVAKAVGGTATYDGSHLRNWVVTMPDGRKWQVEGDASVTGAECGWHGRGGEVVTPVLTYADMETLQKVVRAMRAAGAKVDGTCGSHVHVGAKEMTAKQIRNLVKVFYRQEELILRACGVREERINRYTRKQDGVFVKKVAEMRSPTMDAIADAYYGDCHGREFHYCSARYRTLNLHNIWQGGKRTVEFRLFEGTLHAGEIRANVLLALTLVAYAMDANGTSAGGRRRAYRESSGKYDLRVLLLRLGWIGDEFKNPRKRMMARVGGSAAWKDGEAHGRGRRAA